MMLNKLEAKKNEAVSMKSIILEYSTNKENSWEWLSNNYNFEGYNSILEVGCGDGLFWQYHAPKLSSSHHVSLTDIEQRRLDNSNALIAKIDVKAKFDFSIKDIDKPLETAETSQYDAVLAHSVLHLCKHPTAALQRLNLLLKSGGLMGVSVSEGNPVESLFAVGLESDSEEAPKKSANDNYPASKADVDIVENFKNFTKNKYTTKLSFNKSEPVVHLYAGYLKAANVKLTDEEKFYAKFNDKIQDIINEEREFKTEYSVVHYSIKK